MRIIPVSEILRMTDGNTVEAIHGRVTAVHKRFSGTNAKGEWSLQKVTVQDQTGQIKVMFSGIGDIPQSWIGQDIYIQAGESNGKSGGLCGLTSATDTKSNPPEKIVKASEKAVVQFGQAQQAQQPPTAPPAQTFTPPPQPAFQPPPAAAPVQQAFTPTAPTAPVANDYRHFVNREANLYLSCLKAGRYIRDQYNKDAETPDDMMSDDQFQACVSSMFIAAEKAGIIPATPCGDFKG